MPEYGNTVQLIPAGTVVPAAGIQGRTLSPLNKATLRAVVDVTAVSGTTPGATVTIETSFDAGATDPWRTVGSFGAITAVTGATPARKSFTGVDRYVRATVAVAGTNTPTVTLGVSGELV